MNDIYIRMSLPSNANALNDANDSVRAILSSRLVFSL